MSVNLNLEERQNTFFLKIKMFDNKLAEFNYKVLSRILACGELVSKWDTSVRSIRFQCNEIDSISHLLYECKLAKQIWHIVNRSLLVNIQLEDIVFGTKLTSDLNFAVSLVSFCIYKHWILNHMNIKDRNYSSILSLVKNDIYFRCKILRRTEKYLHCNKLEQILNFICTL